MRSNLLEIMVGTIYLITPEIADGMSIRKPFFLPEWGFSWKTGFLER